MKVKKKTLITRGSGAARVPRFLPLPSITRLNETWLKNTHHEARAVFPDGQLHPVRTTDAAGLVGARNSRSTHLDEPRADADDVTPFFQRELSSRVTKLSGPIGCELSTTT